MSKVVLVIGELPDEASGLQADGAPRVERGRMCCGFNPQELSDSVSSKQGLMWEVFPEEGRLSWGTKGKLQVVWRRQAFVPGRGSGESGAHLGDPPIPQSARGGQEDVRRRWGLGTDSVA